MKKLFSLVMFALLAVSANAQKVWNFSDWDEGEIAAETTKDGLTVVATSNNKVAIDANSKTVDNINYTKRLKLSGTGGDTYRHLKFAVDGPCEIAVVLSSASSSEARKLNVYAGAYNSNNQLVQLDAAKDNTTKETYNYEGEATTIYLGSANSGVNIYAIYVTPTGEPSEPAAPEVAAPTITAGSYDYTKGGWPITITSATEGATVSYKVENGNYTDVENGSTVYVKSGKLYIKASKDGHTAAAEREIGTLNGAPSSTSPETLIAAFRNKDDYDKNVTHDYVSVSVHGDYIAGTYNNNDGMKFRCTRNKASVAEIEGYAFSLNVKEGYKVTKVKITAVSNRAGIINVTAMYVDGVAVTEFTAFEMPSSGGTAVQKEFEVNATSEIAWKMEPGTYSTSSVVDQFNAKIEVTYIPTTPDTKEVTENGWATYIPAFAAQFEEGDAYVVTAISEESVTIESVTAVPANTPVLLKGAGEKTITFVATATAPEKNLLSVYTADVEGKVAYVLAKDGEGAGFKKWTGEEALTGRAVLWIDAASEARGFLSLDGEATGIKDVNAAAAQNGACYDLQGRRVAQPKSGLYIIDGKKVIVK